MFPVPMRIRWFVGMQRAFTARRLPMSTWRLGALRSPEVKNKLLGLAASSPVAARRMAACSYWYADKGG